MDMLVAHGARLDAVNHRGETALDHALANRNFEIAHGLFLRGAPTTRPMTELLGIPDGDLEKQDDRGDTPLIRAVRNADLPLVQALLDAGANVETTDQYGVSPLMFAAKQHGEGIVALLLASGALPQICDKEGRTALHHAVEGQRADNVSILMAAGSDPEAKDHSGKSPIALAASYHMHDIVSLLTGCDPEDAENYQPITVSPYAELRASPNDPDEDYDCDRPIVSRPDELDGVEPVAYAEELEQRQRAKEKKRRKKELKQRAQDEKLARKEARREECVYRVEAPYSPHEMITLEVTMAHVLTAVTGPDKLRHRWTHDEALDGEANATILRRFGQTELDEVVAVIRALRSVEEMNRLGWVPRPPGDGPGPAYEWPASPSETPSDSPDSDNLESVPAAPSQGSMAGMTVVFTGTLTKFTRAQAAALVTERGGRVASTVVEATTFMVAGANAGSKLDRARELGVAILSEDQFYVMIAAL